MGPAMKKRVAILISGRGTNMQALVAAAAAPEFPAEVVSVISNRRDAQGLAWAAARGLATVVVDHRGRADRSAFELELNAALVGAGAELVCCAGFMRLLTAEFVERWRDRILNIHPSLLPAYKGLDTHSRVLADGVRITGCTVHFVRAEMDAGPIVAQAAVVVQPEDDADTLANRVLKAEHNLYPAALALIAAGKATVVGERVQICDAAVPSSTLFSLTVA
jgi:phosphoribosylglycinamide formyltransferase-1